ncbi:MAG: hypothetical protein J5367_04500, partial [Lachnospiraceae bacterium]|nr:hypothetical protein [Lachnospiraceae bacterium]
PNVGIKYMPVNALASEGENTAAVYLELPQGWQTKAVTLPIKSTVKRHAERGAFGELISVILPLRLCGCGRDDVIRAA